MCYLFRIILFLRTRQYDFDLSMRRIFFVRIFWTYVRIYIYMYMWRYNLLLWKKREKVRRWSMMQRSLDLWYKRIMYPTISVISYWLINRHIYMCLYIFIYLRNFSTYRPSSATLTQICNTKRRWKLLIWYRIDQICIYILVVHTYIYIYSIYILKTKFWDSMSYTNNIRT